jgi:hypothetical protein
MNSIGKISEDKITFDHERAFKIRIKGVKLLGLWAAAKLGLESEAADTYARALVSVDFEEAGDEDILRRLLADLEPLGIGRAELVDCLIACVEQASVQ